MSDPRITGLILMTLAIAAFLGTTSNTLPPVTFFPALALFIAGAIKFLRKNHVALEAAEKRTQRALNPVIREDRYAQAHAERQAGRRGEALSHCGAFGVETNAGSARSSSGPAVAPRDEIEINELEADFVVATDVSFPVAVQAGDALADQLRKLNQLLEQGVLTAEEYAVAKTKILS
ncbi:MAG: SHOCT domain-containing protein [Proteobacteria bacterium]|nr:SHOCT domain-containing protein [Pseudomonadota bacterium]